MFILCLWQLDRNRSTARHKEKITSDPLSYGNKRYNLYKPLDQEFTSDLKIHFVSFSCCVVALILMFVISAALSSGVSSQVSGGRSCWTSCTPQQSLLVVLALHLPRRAVLSVATALALVL